MQNFPTMDQFSFNHLIKLRPQYYHALSTPYCFHTIFPTILHVSRPPPPPPPATYLQTNRFQLSFNHSIIKRLDFRKMGCGYFSFHFFFLYFFYFDLNFIDFMNFSFVGIWFLLDRCKHCRRRCRIHAPCCNEVYTCRHCHKEATVFLDPFPLFTFVFILKILSFLFFSDLGLCYFLYV